MLVVVLVAVVQKPICLNLCNDPDLRFLGFFHLMEYDPASSWLSGEQD
jgi:hypothetical protein